MGKMRHAARVAGNRGQRSLRRRRARRRYTGCDRAGRASGTGGGRAHGAGQPRCEQGGSRGHRNWCWPRRARCSRTCRSPPSSLGSWRDASIWPRYRRPAARASCDPGGGGPGAGRFRWHLAGTGSAAAGLSGRAVPSRHPRHAQRCREPAPGSWRRAMRRIARDGPAQDRHTAHVLIKGADEPTPEVYNTLFSADGGREEFTWPRLPGVYHGSGCTLASAAAALLAWGSQARCRKSEAQRYTWEALKRGWRLGHGQTIPNRQPRR